MKPTILSFALLLALMTTINSQMDDASIDLTFIDNDDSGSACSDMMKTFGCGESLSCLSEDSGMCLCAS